jgi:hypothetical protein
MINHCENSQKNEEAQKKRLDYAKTRCTNLLLDIWSSLDAINGGHPYKRGRRGPQHFLSRLQAIFCPVQITIRPTGCSNSITRHPNGRLAINALGGTPGVSVAVAKNVSDPPRSSSSSRPNQPSSRQPWEEEKIIRARHSVFIRVDRFDIFLFTNPRCLLPAAAAGQQKYPNLT